MARPLRIPVEGDPSGLRKALGVAKADVKKAAADISREKFAVKLDADIAAAEAKTRHLEEQLEQLRRKPTSVKVDADIAAAQARLAALDVRLDRLRNQRVEVKVDVDTAGIDRADRHFTLFGAKVRKTSVIAAGAVAGLGIAISKITAPVSMASYAPLLLTITQAALEASGALALLPAAGFAAAGAFAALKIGAMGFADAMKQLRGTPEEFAEAIKTLAPAAQDTAVALRSMVPAFDGMRLHVQQQLFAGLADTVRQLGQVYLPVMTARLGDVAGAMSLTARLTASALMAPSAVGAVNQVLAATADALRELAPAFGDLLAGLLQIGRVGSQFLPGLATSAANVAARFREWATAAAASGQINDMIVRGIAVITDLGRIVGNVGKIVQGIFRSIATDGAGLVATFERLTATALQWVNSAAGQEKIAQIFDSLGKVSFALVEALPHLAGAVSTLVGWFVALPEPVQNVIGKFIGWGSVIGFVMKAISPLILLLESRFVLALGRAALAAAQFGATLLVAIGPIGWIGIAVVALVALIVLNWDTVKRVTVETWNVVSAAVTAAWGAVTAAVTTAIAVVTSTLTAAWSSVTAATAAAWTAVVTAVTGAVTAVVAAVTGAGQSVIAAMSATWASAQAAAVSAWNAIVGAVQGAVGSLLGVVRALPGQIVGALGDMAGLLLGAGRNLVQGLIAGIQAMAAAAAAAAVAVVRNAAAAAWAAVQPGSPSRLTMPIGLTAGQGIAAGIIASIPAVEASMERLVATARVSAAAALAGLGTVEVTAGGLRVSAGPGGVAVTGGQGGGQVNLLAELRAIRELLERRGVAANIVVEDRSANPVETARATALAIRLA